MKILEFIKRGMLLMADSAVEARHYSYPKVGGFERDQMRLTGDVHSVGIDMKKTIKKYGSEQSYKRPGA